MSGVGKDCAWVGVNDACEELHSLELAHFCGCTCNAGGAESVRAPHNMDYILTRWP